LGWVTQEIQPSGFRCSPSSINAVTLDVSVTAAQGGSSVLLNAGKRLAIGPFNQRYLRGRVEQFKQKVGELAEAGQAPGGTQAAGPPRAQGSISDRADQAAAKVSGNDPEKSPEELRILGMNREQRGDSPGVEINWPTMSGTGGELAADNAKTVWLDALMANVRRGPAGPLTLESRFRYLAELERDVDAGKIALSPQERKNLGEARAEVQRDLHHHRNG
jgi:hypothetical protein